MKLNVSTVGPATLMLLAGMSLVSAETETVPSDAGATFESIGPIAFGPDGVLFAADNRAATIYALELGSEAAGKTPGAKDIPAIDQKIADMLGTDPREITVTDLAIGPGSKNAFLSVERGQGANAKAALLRVDGAGNIDVVALDKLTHTKIAIPNAPEEDLSARRNPRAATVTDMAYTNGRVFIAGLSNEEFASKLRSVAYPFESMDEGTSVEIYHGAHGQWETRSPVYTFVPYELDSEPHLIAGYLCTPLVKFPVKKLAAGEKVVGTTIAELGNRNRPIDMIVYTKDGKDYILMSNTSRGVMKIPTDDFAAQEGITSPIEDKAGIAYHTVAELTGVEQLDLYDDGHSIVMKRTDSGALDLHKVALP